MSSTFEETLERAYRHVCDGWIPAQSEVLERIRSRLGAGEYQGNREQLKSDLKEDFSLYVYCLKELAALLAESDTEGSGLLKRTPVEILNSSPLENFKRVFEAEDSDISKHCFSEMNEFQASRLKESMLSASAAETLCPSISVDADTGFSCAMLRQLGLALISWNYPRVYARAVEKLDATTSLDLALRRVLGFTPALLGLRIVEKWNLSEEICEALKESKVTRPNSPERLGNTLAKICEVGEALARANDPDHYPSAMEDWDHAQEEIARYLGPSGVKQIYDKAQEHLRQYSQKIPELLSFTETDDLKERISGSHYATSLLEKNLYLRTVSEDLRQDIRKLYTHFKPNKILKANVEIFVQDLISKAGFIRGAIFMYDPERRILAPAVNIGNIPKEKLQSVKVFSVLAQYDLIASAFSLKTPLREEGTSDEGKPIVSIAAALGQVTPIGVLYLETSEDFTQKHGSDPMPNFRALRQTLCDCLNVS